MTGNCSNICFMWMSCKGGRIWQRSTLEIVEEKAAIKPLTKIEIKLAIAFAIVQQRWKKMKQAEHIVPPVDIEYRSKLFI